MSRTVYITPGNSDDKLTQRQWSELVGCIQDALQGLADRDEAVIHGSWRSRPDDPWQNACWCVQFAPESVAVEPIRELLGELAAIYHQDSITWTEAAAVEFLEPRPIRFGAPDFADVPE